MQFAERKGVLCVCVWVGGGGCMGMGRKIMRDSHKSPSDLSIHLPLPASSNDTHKNTVVKIPNTEHFLEIVYNGLQNEMVFTINVTI